MDRIEKKGWNRYFSGYFKGMSCLFWGRENFVAILLHLYYVLKSAGKRDYMVFLKRTPRNYRGTDPTGRAIKDVLPRVLGRIGKVCKNRPQLIVEYWKEVVGAKFAPMTRAISFEEGVLLVKVSNSTLHSLLAGQEKKRILRALRSKFPQVEIRDVIFRMG